MIDVAVTAMGVVDDRHKDHARERMARLDRYIGEPVLGARVVLKGESNPRLERPARAEAELNVNGHIVRGHVAAATMSEAVDELSAHIEHQLHGFADRRLRLAQRPPESIPGEWHRGAWSPPRPGYFPRPVEERSIVRRKTFAVGALHPRRAAAEMLDLDHDFYLFGDSETGADAVVYRRDDGRIGLIHPAGVSSGAQARDGLVRETSRMSEPILLETAVSEMNALSHRFMFFTDAQTGRGNVIYMRYDGHYGLIEPAG